MGISCIVKMLLLRKNIVFNFIITSSLVISVLAKDDPKFVGPGQNVTVVVGRDATLTCRLENLLNFKVAWLRVDTQTILTIGPHVITKNHRVGVTRGDSQTWVLTLREVRTADAGQYMCQINTEPMITQTHILQVVVPPDITRGSSSEVMVREGDNVTLHCVASGTPAPNITWRREDSALMPIGEVSVNKWSGEWLNMTSVTRESNGPFLCIATNGVPPSVSKRIILHVLCAPLVWAVQKMIGGYIGSPVILQCRVEAYPMQAMYWTHLDGIRLHDGTNYQGRMKSEGYRHIASMTVSNLSRNDIGTYHCHVENSLGKSSADITLYTLATTTTSTTTHNSTSTSLTATFPSTAEVITELFNHESHIPTSIDIKDQLMHQYEDKNVSKEGNYVAVLSQHQMQSLDLSPSS